MSDFIDDFLAGLEEDKQKPRTSEGIEKLLMSSRDNQGTVVFAPFMDTNTKKFYTLLTGVKEYNTPISTFGEGNTSVWMKILPKEFYGELTDSQSKLYDEVSNLFDQVNDELGEVTNKWSRIRLRSYSLFQGVLINHRNSQGEVVNSNLGKATLLIFPSRQPINELAAAIKNKIVAMNNSKEWIPAIFAPTDKDRAGVITISFTKPDSPGYNCSVAFEFNSSFAKVIDPTEGYPEEVTKLFGDTIDLFLGWQNGKSGKFNEENFIELKKILEVELRKLDVTRSASNPESVPNKNGADPMLSSTPTSVAAGDSDPKVDLPF